MKTSLFAWSGHDGGPVKEAGAGMTIIESVSLRVSIPFYVGGYGEGAVVPRGTEWISSKDVGDGAHIRAPTPYDPLNTILPPHPVYRSPVSPLLPPLPCLYPPPAVALVRRCPAAASPRRHREGRKRKVIF